MDETTTTTETEESAYEKSNRINALKSEAYRRAARLMLRYNPEKARVYMEMAGKASTSGSKTYDMEAASKAYEDAKNYLVEWRRAVKNADGKKADEYAYKIAEAEALFFKITGKQMTGINMNSAERNAIDEKMNSIKLEKGQEELDQLRAQGIRDTAKDERDLLSMINDRINKYFTDRKTWVENWRKVQSSINAINNAFKEVGPDGQVSPAKMALVTKTLSQLIEPGLAVTEGEVRMYQGSTQWLDLISRGANTIKEWLANGFDAESTMAAMRRADISAYNAMVREAKNYANKVGNLWAGMVTGGLNEVAKYLYNDIQDSSLFGKVAPNVADRHDVSYILGKLQAEMGTNTNQTIDTSNGKTDEPPANIPSTPESVINNAAIQAERNKKAKEKGDKAGKGKKSKEEMMKILNASGGKK